MRFSESEIEALMLVAGSERALHPRDLSMALNLRPETLSRVVTGLVDKGLLEREGKEIALARTPAAEAFKRLYFAHRASPFPLLLADRRVDLLSRIESTQKSVEMLERETDIPKKTIYRYLKDILHLGIVKRSKEGRAYLYSFNFILWPANVSYRVPERYVRTRNPRGPRQCAIQGRGQGSGEGFQLPGSPG